MVAVDGPSATSVPALLSVTATVLVAFGLAALGSGIATAIAPTISQPARKQTA
jgi:hypothetical protein